MRNILLAAAITIGTLGAVALPAAPASAQYRGHYGYGDREVRREIRECRRELRRADSRREYRREQRECRREISRARWEDRYDRYDRYDRRYDRRRYRNGYRGW